MYNPLLSISANKLILRKHYYDLVVCSGVYDFDSIKSLLALIKVDEATDDGSYDVFLSIIAFEISLVICIRKKFMSGKYDDVVFDSVFDSVFDHIYPLIILNSPGINVGVDPICFDYALSMMKNTHANTRDRIIKSVRDSAMPITISVYLVYRSCIVRKSLFIDPKLNTPDMVSSFSLIISGYNVITSFSVVVSMLHLLGVFEVEENSKRRALEPPVIQSYLRKIIMLL